MYITNIEPMHHEQGAYRNWYNHYRNRWFKSWSYWTRDKRLGSRGNMYVGPLTETDLLASQLFALHEEALGEPHSWLDLKPEQREAWIQVAQFVEAHYAIDEPDHK